MKRKLKNVLSIICTVLILIQTIPITVMAKDSDTTIESVSEHINDVQDEENGENIIEFKPEIIGEDTGRREPTVKHFRRSDGTYTAAIYSEPVHYNENGEMVEIDNTLVLDNTKKENRYYTNKSNALKVKLPEVANTTTPVEVSNQGYTLTWTFSSQNSSLAKIEQPEEKTVSLKEIDSKIAKAKTVKEKTELNDNKKTRVFNKKSSVTYSSVYKNVDLKYDVQSTKLKESLILNALSDQACFSFDIQSGNLTAKLQENNAVYFYAKDNADPVFKIEVPYMFDSNQEYSWDIKVDLIPIKGGHRYSITPDREWLESDERIYPVTVDPTISIKCNYQTIHDERGLYGTLNNMKDEVYSGIYLYAGHCENAELVSMVHIDLPSYFSSSSKIIAAKMSLCPYFITDGDIQVNAYQITSKWNERWAETRVIRKDGEIPSYNDTILDYAIVNSVYDWYSFDITKAVNDWLIDGENWGIMFRCENPPFSGEYASFYDSDHVNELPDGTPYNFDPRFEITYRDAKGLEDYWTYTSLPAGDNGSVAVNNFNGNLIITQDDICNDGQRMPIAISHFYNSGTALNSAAGYRWQTNFNMRIFESQSELASQGYRYCLVDADGTDHYFFFNGSTTEGKDEDGLGYTLLVNPASSNDYYTITDKNGWKMIFNNNGILQKISDTNDNNITINVDSSGNIYTVTDGAGRSYSYYYYNGYIQRITDFRGRNVLYEYEVLGDDKRNLTSITYPNGNKSSIYYKINTSLVEKVTASDGAYITVQYTNKKPERVEAISFYGNKNELNTSYTFNYHHNATTITSNTGDKVTYQFNSAGQTVGVVNQITKQAQYFEYGAPGIQNGKENKLLSASKTQSSIYNYFNNPGCNSSTSGWITFYSKSNQSYTFSTDSNGHNGTKCVKISQTSTNPGLVWHNQDVTVLNSGYYTVSGCFSTKGGTLGGTGAKIYIEVVNSSGTVVSNASSELLHTTGINEWKRLISTVYVNSGNKLRLFAGLSGTTVGTVYMDSFQMESGETVNSFNLLENTNFINTSGWNGCNFTVLSDSSAPEGRCMRFTKPSEMDEKHIYQTIPVSGNKGDIFSFGAWAKADSIQTTNNPKNGNIPNFKLSLAFMDANNNIIGDYHRAKFNYDTNEWQFVSNKAKAADNYEKVRVWLSYDYNVNDCRYAIPYVYREEYGETYDYDKNGNLKSSVDLANTQANFAYKDNQLSKLLNPTGSRFLYTYNSKNNLVYAHSTNGQRYEITYDNYGNPTSATVTPREFASTIEPGKYYHIFNAYSGNALAVNTDSPSKIVHNYRYQSSNPSQIWTVNLAGYGPDVFTLKPMLEDKDYRLEVVNGSTSDNAQLRAAEKADSAKQRFMIVRNPDGTFSIRTGTKPDFSKCVDGQPNSDLSTEDGSPVLQKTYDSSKEGQKWYFVEFSAGHNPTEIIKSTAEYSPTYNRNFMTGLINADGSKAEWTYENGLLKTAKDFEGNITQYDYNYNNDRLTKVQNGSSYIVYEYNKNKLSKIIHNNSRVQYNFVYDQFGRKNQVKVGNPIDQNILSSTQYNERNLVAKQTYGNQDYINFQYDELDRVTYKSYNGSSTEAAAYVYNKEGLLGIVKDYKQNRRITYTYDMAGRPVEIKTTGNADSDNGTDWLKEKYTYESGKNRLLSRLLTIGGVEQPITQFVYGQISSNQIPDFVYKVKQGGADSLAYTYDVLGRRKSREISTGYSDVTITSQYSYITYNTTTTLLRRINNAGKAIRYSYDSNGNITAIYGNDNEFKHTFKYDGLNQLTRHDDVDANRTTLYEYDSGGNILTKTEYTYTPSDVTPSNPINIIDYNYDNHIWTDQLTNYNNEVDEYNTPVRYTYDVIGNPLTYRNGMTMSWTGRMLDGITQNGMTYTYTYDIDGIRTSKYVNGHTNRYFLSGGEVVREEPAEGNIVTYLFDENGARYGFKLRNSQGQQTYWYIFNGQGDVIALIDKTGTWVVNYTYDAWGKPLTITDQNGNPITDPLHVGNLNPIRYRGYYYDVETGLYSLHSRYYDPVTGRFINGDDSEILFEDQDNILQYNLFAYCFNNPVNMHDPDGYAAANIIGGIIGGAAGATLGYLLAKQLGLTGWKKWALISAATIGGAALGAFLGPYVAKLGGKVAAKLGIKTAGRQVVKRSFSQLIKDISSNPRNWKMTKQVISKSTNMRNKGGLSIERIYKCKKTGEYIYEHILKDKFGKIIDQHFRPYGK